MSSTDRDAAARVAAEALYDVLAPLAERLKASGFELFPLGRDASKESYFVTRPRASMRREDFEGPSCEGFDDFESRVAAMWNASPHRDLAPLAPRFAALARLAFALEADDGEVSPFVYVMF